MTTIHGAQQTLDVVYFCPQCGSASLEMTTKALLLPGGPGNRATCTACKWAGPETDLIVTPIMHEFADSEEIVKGLMGDMRVMLAKHFAVSFLPFLKKWGFMPQPTAQLAQRYVVAIAKGILDAVIAERVKIEEEKSRVG